MSPQKAAPLHQAYSHSISENTHRPGIVVWPPSQSPSGATARELRETAKSKGFQTLADAAIRRVLEGDSTLTEVLRAVDLTLMQRTPL